MTNEIEALERAIERIDGNLSVGWGDVNLCIEAARSHLAGLKAGVDGRREAAFEAWLKTRAISTDKCQDSWGREMYAHSHVQAMWEAWQAAPQSPAQGITAEEAREILLSLKQALAEDSASRYADFVRKSYGTTRRALQSFVPEPEITNNGEGDGKWAAR